MMRWAVAALAAAVMWASPVGAQALSEMTRVNDPRAYAESAIADFERIPFQNGARALFRAVLIDDSNEQINAAITAADSILPQRTAIETALILEEDFGDRVRDVYAMTYYGENKWFYWRMSFLFVQDVWVLTDVQYNAYLENVVPDRPRPTRAAPF